ncbi:MAG: hypothetical protein CTY35_07540 [Methylotenera sp.]|nr:MAG: hypothetical protein CTY35_07540 [Methylotenera sp.]PPD50045.1 MAG: hypothetical protein CTY12_10075 [Methylotenera sp.]
MFQTYNHAKIYLPFSSSGESAWAYAELMINGHWFFADCQISEDEISVSTSYILSSPIQLNELRANQNVTIKGIYVLSPPHMNFTELWRMDQVAQVSTGTVIEDDYKIKVEIFELSNGKKYYSTDVVGKEHIIEDIQVVFSV